MENIYFQKGPGGWVRKFPLVWELPSTPVEARGRGWVGESPTIDSSWSSFGQLLKPSLQDLAFYVTEMPAEQLKRKVTLLLMK